MKTKVTWPEPQFRDNSNSPLTISCSHNSGASFFWGEWNVHCRAYDNNPANAPAICEFVLIVKREYPIGSRQADSQTKTETETEKKTPESGPDREKKKKRYACLLYIHECFTGKYAMRKTHTNQNQRPKWHVFHIFTQWGYHWVAPFPALNGWKWRASACLYNIKENCTAAWRYKFYFLVVNNIYFTNAQHQYVTCLQVQNAFGQKRLLKAKANRWKILFHMKHTGAASLVLRCKLRISEWNENVWYFHLKLIHSKSLPVAETAR